jgi:nicotinamide riboside kinase
MSRMGESPQRSTFVICVTGPECTGKTTLAHDLGNALGAQVVEEYAREYASTLRDPAAPWAPDKYVAVAAEQLARVELAASTAADFVVADTDPFTVWVWHRNYTDRPLDDLREIAERAPCDLRVCCDIDIPFRPDGIRHLVRDRREIYQMFAEECAAFEAPCLYVSGTRAQRVNAVLDEVRRRVGR